MKKVSAILLLFIALFLSCSKPDETLMDDPSIQTELRKIPIEYAALAAIHLPGFPDFLIADGAGVWVTNIGRLEKLVLGSDTPVATVTMPSPCGAGVSAFGSLWVASCSNKSLYRIDKTTFAITSIINTGLADPSGELSVAAGAGSVWLLTKSSGILTRIDPATNSVVSEIAVEPKSYAAAFGFGAVWISNTGDGFSDVGSVQRIDPATNQVVATIPVGKTPHFIAAGEGGVWVINQGDGTVTRIDPATNAVVANIHIRAFGSGGDITTGAGRVWVRASNAFLFEIDPVMNTVANTYIPPQGSGAVRVADGDIVWASSHDANTVWAFKK
jgi:YVTN family beta-propeller protein